MKKAYLVLMLLVFSHTSFATSNTLVDEIPQDKFDGINLEIKAQATWQSGNVALKNFSVDWNKAKCVFEYDELYDANVGVCMVPFSAYQLYGNAAVTSAQGVYKIAIINADNS